MNTRQFLAAARRKLEERRGESVSDYRLAKELEVSTATMSRYMLGKSTLDEPVCDRVAALLGLHPGYVRACIQAERASSVEGRSVWLDVAEKLRALAAVFLAAAGVVALYELAGPEVLTAFTPVAFLLPRDLPVIHIVTLSGVALGALFLAGSMLCELRARERAENLSAKQRAKLGQRAKAS